MIRKTALQMAVPVLLVLMALNGYLVIRYLNRIRTSASLTQESASVQANIARVSQDLTDMETGQRGYLLTEDSEYLQPYTDAKNRIGSDLASLRSGLANRAENERSLVGQLESFAGSKQAEMERTISLREQGYRHRAFVMVASNEGRDYMNQARGVLTALGAMESGRFAGLEKERNVDLSKALSGTILANLCLLAFTAGLFALIRYHERRLEQEAAASKAALGARDLQLEKLTSALSNEARNQIATLEEHARLLLQKYEGFLPRQGCEYAGVIKESAAQLEKLRKDLLGIPVASLDEKAA
jgi:CHASE3 domain sensor protein